MAMPTAFISPQMRDLTGGQSSVEIQAAATVRQVIDALERQFPGIKMRLCKGDQLADTLQVVIDGSLTSRSMLAKVSPTSEVHFLPALGGG